MAEATVCGSTWGTGTEPHNYRSRSEEHTSELQSRSDLVCRLLLEKKKKKISSILCQAVSTIPNGHNENHHLTCLHLASRMNTQKYSSDATIHVSSHSIYARKTRP